MNSDVYRGADPCMRQAYRYEIAAPVNFWWSCSGAPAQAGEGVTRDIGASGLWIEANACPPAGALIQITVFFPSAKGSGRAVSLVGEGIVVRVETSDPSTTNESITGFAVQGQFYLENWH